MENKGSPTSTDLSIKEITYRLNFEDSSYLTRYFKKQTGMTLTQYRK
ncbi:helix-turn-helix domain-containing protein [Sphingobacterium sp. E70]